MSDVPIQQSECLVTDKQNGLRLDQLLTGNWPEKSRAFFQKCIADGNVLLNNSTANPSRRVKIGDHIKISWPPPVSEKLQAEEIPLDILFEDDDILVINKPPGLVVHPGRGNTTGTLVQGLLFRDRKTFAAMKDDEQRPGIVHRLDKDTSGVLVVAKNQPAETSLKESFKNRLTVKTYLAVAIGHFHAASGQIDEAIGRNPHSRRKMAVRQEDGKPALTRYRILAEAETCSLLEICILTGRTHQIRVHLTSVGHPVLGDPLYGGRPRKMTFLPERQMLHAWKLSFPHPKTGQITQCTAPIPEDFQGAMQILQLNSSASGPLARIPK
jgi:23S rRNA pseudouridine1911/1915/1917 synthase